MSEMEQLYEAVRPSHREYSWEEFVLDMALIACEDKTPKSFEDWRDAILRLNTLPIACDTLTPTN